MARCQMILDMIKASRYCATLNDQSEHYDAVPNDLGHDQSKHDDAAPNDLGHDQNEHDDAVPNDLGYDQSEHDEAVLRPILDMIKASKWRGTE